MLMSLGILILTVFAELVRVWIAFASPLAPVPMIWMFIYRFESWCHFDNTIIAISSKVRPVNQLVGCSHWNDRAKKGPCVIRLVQINPFLALSKFLSDTVDGLIFVGYQFSWFS